VTATATGFTTADARTIELAETRATRHEPVGSICDDGDGDGAALA